MKAKPSKSRKSKPKIPKVKLRYIPDSVAGYGRIKRGKGVSYVDQHGDTVTDKKKLNRFRQLTIPPAWTEVWISPSGKGHLQATGIDEQGRKQYLYHPAWTAERQQKKVRRMIDFGASLPGIREQITRDIRSNTLTKGKITAIALRVMEETLIRVGNDRYLHKYNSHGLTTLKKKHVDISGNVIEFRFRGKKKIRQEIQVRNARLAARLIEMQQLRGVFFFQYLDETGKPCRLRPDDINHYLQQYSVAAFSSKDFRTWYAGLWTFRLLAGYPEYTDEKACSANIVEVLDAVSDRLGNTRSVCKQYYVPDNLLTAYQDGSLLPYLVKSKQKNRLPTLKQAETYLLAFFHEYSE